LGEITFPVNKRYDVFEELKRKNSKHIELIGFEHVNCEISSKKTVIWTSNYNSVGCDEC
jgi:hypothetical protein